MVSFKSFSQFAIMFGICLAIGYAEDTLNTLGCETIATIEDWSGDSGVIKACLMNETTTIDSPNFEIKIEDGTSVKEIFFSSNENVSYLPNGMGTAFPELLVLDATYCSILSISKRNFENMKKLQYLWLGENMLRQIDNDTFNGLMELRQLFLHNNLIKMVSSDVFAGLPKLRLIGLSGNVCINRDFEGKGQIVKSLHVVSEDCGSKEAVEVELRKAIKRIADEIHQQDVLLEKCACKAEN